VYLGGVQQRRVFHCGVHERVAATPIGRERPERRGGEGLGAVRREAHLVRPGADALGHGFARRVEKQLRPTPGTVEPARIGPAVVERGEQCLAGDRMQRRGRCRVQVCAHDIHASPVSGRGRGVQYAPDDPWTGTTKGGS